MKRTCKICSVHGVFLCNFFTAYYVSVNSFQFYEYYCLLPGATRHIHIQMDRIFRSSSMFSLNYAHKWLFINTGGPAQRQSGAVEDVALPMVHFKITIVKCCSGCELLHSTGGKFKYYNSHLMSLWHILTMDGSLFLNTENATYLKCPVFLFVNITRNQI